MRALPGFRTSPVTAWPVATSWRTSSLPMNPDAPVTKTRIPHPIASDAAALKDLAELLHHLPPTVPASTLWTCGRWSAISCQESPSFRLAYNWPVVVPT